MGVTRAWFPSRRSTLHQMGGLVMVLSGQVRSGRLTPWKGMYFLMGLCIMVSSLFSEAGHKKSPPPVSCRGEVVNSTRYHPNSADQKTDPFTSYHFGIRLRPVTGPPVPDYLSPGRLRNQSSFRNGLSAHSNCRLSGNPFSDLLSFAVIFDYIFELDVAYYKFFYNGCQPFWEKCFKKMLKKWGCCTWVISTRTTTPYHQ